MRRADSSRQPSFAGPNRSITSLDSLPGTSTCRVSLCRWRVVVVNETLTPVLITECSELLAMSRDRALVRVASLEDDWQNIVDAADTANLDDEHDPEGSTVAYERAMVISLL